jgi:hypothetical protein
MADWIKDATSNNKGALRNAAKKAGMSTKEYAEKNKDAQGTKGARSRLALTLMGLNKKKG